MAEATIRAVLKAYVAAWVAGDVAAVVASYHDDFELTYFGANALSGHHVGKPAALAVLGEFTRRSGRQLIGTPAVLAGDARGVVIARERLGSGEAAIEADRVLVYTIADDRLRTCCVYDSDQAAIDRLIGPA